MDRKEKDKLLELIIHPLILNSSFTTNLGLLNGKMGIIIFFLLYSRYKKEERFEEFAGELLDEIYEEMGGMEGIDFENGLSGIAWGMEYLTQQGFIECMTGDTLEEMDVIIMKKDPRRMDDFSFKNGLGGIAYYMAVHLQSPFLGKTVIDSDYLTDLRTAIQRIIHSDQTHEIPDLAIDYFINNNSCSLTLSSVPPFLLTNHLTLNDENELFSLPLGIEKGLSGLGLKLITA